jgi:hypothetical protein
MTARRVGVPVLIAIVIGFIATPAPASAGSGAATFERLKGLVGTWEARDEKGNLRMRTVYETIAGGKSLVEKLYPGDLEHGDMMSVYHMDGNDLIITHYCMVGNQPTMVADAAAGDRVTFTFQRATNLARTSDGHMGALEVTFKDDDHFTQVWTWMEGDTSKPDRMDYTRIR